MRRQRLAMTTLNGIVAHEDWLPTFAAAAGYPNIKQQLADGTSPNGRQHRNYDDGQIVAIRYNDWKLVFLENRGEAFGVWREPFTELRVPLLFNLRRDPFEKSQHNSNTYNDWFLDRPFLAVPMQQLAGRFLMTMKEYPPSQTPGLFNLEKIQRQLEVGPRQ